MRGGGVGVGEGGGGTWSGRGLSFGSSMGRSAMKGVGDAGALDDDRKFSSAEGRLLRASGTESESKSLLYLTAP